MKYLKPHRNDLLSDLSRNFDLLLSSFDDFPKIETSGLSTTNWAPKIDIKEQDNQYIVYADVPGIDPSAIEVSVDNGILTIKGHKETEKKDEKKDYLRVERSSGSFLRQMTLPESVDAGKVKAKGKNGVLEIILPKAEKSTARKITVEK
jgi:HSP20 family protein